MIFHDHGEVLRHAQKIRVMKLKFPNNYNGLYPPKEIVGCLTLYYHEINLKRFQVIFLGLSLKKYQNPRHLPCFPPLKKKPGFPSALRQSGNALFLILIAVALFAALSYAVTQSGRGNNSITKEQAHLLAARMIQYGANIHQAVQRAIIINGCDPYTTVGNNLFGDPASFPGDCNLFDQYSGGGAAYQQIANNDPVFYDTSANNNGGEYLAFINSMPVAGVGTSLEDVTMIFHNIREDICIAANKILGIENPGGSPPEEDTPFEGGWSQPPFAWNVANCPGGWSLLIGCSEGSDPAFNELYGRPVGCYMADRPGTDMGYYLYYVVQEL